MKKKPRFFDGHGCLKELPYYRTGLIAPHQGTSDDEIAIITLF